MAQKVVWTEPALEDLTEIHEFIRRDSWAHADILAERIKDAAANVGEFPLSGRIVSELSRKEVREVIVGSYRVVYRIKRGTIQILRVFHSARLLRLA